MQKHKFLLILVFCFSSIVSFGQNELRFGQRIIIGTSLTYIQHTDEFIRTNRYHEFTWDKNIAININRSLYAGISFKNIYTRGASSFPSDQKSNYIMAGGFFQYDFLPKQKNRLFLEASWNWGNYCTCDPEPYKEENLNYLGVGGGYDFPLRDNISLDLSFVTYNILKDIEYKFGYTQYTIGLNFDFTKQKLTQKTY